ncbi:protein yhcG [Salmonella enterica subsp. enterica]|nr:protein yhcG [Salmonella enterica subsp. enterica]
MPKSTGQCPEKTRQSAWFCAQGKARGEAHYALTGLPNTIMASEYKVQLPDEKLLTDELIRSQTMLETQLTRGGSLTTEKN